MMSVVVEGLSKKNAGEAFLSMILFEIFGQQPYIQAQISK